MVYDQPIGAKVRVPLRLLYYFLTPVVCLTFPPLPPHSLGLFRSHTSRQQPWAYPPWQRLIGGNTAICVSKVSTLTAFSGGDRAATENASLGLRTLVSYCHRNLLLSTPWYPS